MFYDVICLLKDFGKWKCVLESFGKGIRGYGIIRHRVMQLSSDQGNYHADKLKYFSFFIVDLLTNDIDLIS